VKSPDAEVDRAYERGGNLYLRGTDGGAEGALTTDGTPDYGWPGEHRLLPAWVTNARDKTELRLRALVAGLQRLIAQSGISATLGSCT
jgi:hypothetical protein